MNIVLYEPEIPENAGNIGRTCLAAGAALHLIEPLGFFLNEKRLKRAGMDYWKELTVFRYADWEEFEEQNKDASLWFVSTKARKTYAEVTYGEDDFLVFGKESAGLPEELLVQHEERCIRIPMVEKARSLNLSNAVSIVLYEAMRQNSFSGLKTKGELHRLSWQGQTDQPLPI